MKLSKVDVLKAALEGKQIQKRLRYGDWQDHLAYLDFNKLMDLDIEVRLKPKTETRRFSMSLNGQKFVGKPNIKITFKDGEPISAQIIKGEVK